MTKRKTYIHISETKNILNGKSYSDTYDNEKVKIVIDTGVDIIEIKYRRMSKSSVVDALDFRWIHPYYVIHKEYSIEFQESGYFLGFNTRLY